MNYTKVRNVWKSDASAFWTNAAGYVHWTSPWDDVLVTQPEHRFSWFDGAFTNASYNCLDRHLEAGRGGQIAIAFDIVEHSHINFSGQFIFLTGTGHGAIAQRHAEHCSSASGILCHSL